MRLLEFYRHNDSQLEGREEEEEVEEEEGEEVDWVWVAPLLTLERSESSGAKSLKKGATE